MKINDKLLEEKYSTTETKTNQVWIDGKPIYRKVITGAWPSSNVLNWTRVPNFEGNIRLLKVYGIQEALSGYDRNDIPRYESSSNFVVFAEIQGTLSYRLAGYTNRNFRIVVEYVKP